MPSPRTRISLALCASALTLIACAAPGDASRSIELGTSATLAPNESVSVNSTSLQVSFLAVVSDSRCPRDATCVWEGQAVVRFAVSDGERSVTHEIPTREAVTLGAQRLVCESVQPERPSEGNIPAADYRVTIRIE